MRSDEAATDTVFDRAAATYARVGPDQFAHFAHRLVERLPIAAGASVLDLACGAGAVASAVAATAPLVGRLVGVDLSLEMLGRAVEELRPCRVPGGVARMDGHVLGFPDRVFDAVVSGSALDSFPEPGRALAEIHRVLRRGGNLAIWIAPSWWWEGDPRWTWHSDLLAVLGAPVGRGSIGLGGAESVQVAIEAASFEHVSVATETLELHFADADEWWAWVWSHGSRQFLEALTSEQLAAYRATAFERIGRRGIDGRMEAFLATAERPHL